MEARFWDQRYGEDEFVYGQEPNVYVRQCAERYLNAAPCHVVEMACGEGRNVAYLAASGHTVTAVDFSQAGLDKTLRLTAALGGPDAAARVTPVRADILSWRPPGGPGSVDCVVLSFCHVTREERPGFVRGVAEMLKPGGLLVHEVFHPNQIHKGYRPTSGGPHDPEMMVALQEMRSLLEGAGGTELEGEEVEYELKEGRLHSGLGAVTRYVWRKAEAAAV